MKRGDDTAAGPDSGSHMDGDGPTPGSPDEIRHFASLLRLRAETFAHTAVTIRSSLNTGGLLTGGFSKAIRREGTDIIEELSHGQARRSVLLAEHLERTAARLEDDRAQQ